MSTKWKIGDKIQNRYEIHQNVTRARYVQPIEGKPYLFLEYVSGGDLGGWIGTPRLIKDLPQVLNFALQFCDGMIHALSKGIKAHRDIKPQNCLITDDGILKVTDFGLAKIFDEAMDVEWEKEKADERVNPRVSSISLTHTGAVAGTLTHMAPEQFDDAKHVDVRADIYAFGVLLYQMITGQLPLVGRTWREFERLHKTAPPPPLDTDHSQLAALVQTCLAKDRSHRFTNFDVVREQLVEIYEKLTGKLAPKQTIGKELDAWEWNNKGMSLGNLGRYATALSCYDVALKINLRFEPAWYNRGLTLTKLGRYEEAVTSSNHAIEINSSSEAAWSNKGVALWYLGQHNEALDCYNRSIELNPYYVQAWTNKGITFKDLKRYEELLACHARALELNPNLDLVWFNQAGTFEVLGRYEDAIASYNKALELNPRLEHAWHNKGKILTQLQRYEKAISCYDHTIELAPRFEPAWCNKGMALEVLGRFNEALACYNHAVELDPKDVIVWTNKGNLFGKLEHYSDALFCYNHAITLDPKFPDTWFNKGTLLATSLHQYEEAITCFDRVLEIKPRDEQAWINKGAALGNSGDLRKALVCFEEAQRLGNSQAALAIAMCRKELGAYE